MREELQNHGGVKQWQTQTGLPQYLVWAVHLFTTLTIFMRKKSCYFTKEAELRSAQCCCMHFVSVKPKILPCFSPFVLHFIEALLWSPSLCPESETGTSTRCCLSANAPCQSLCLFFIGQHCLSVDSFKVGTLIWLPVKWWQTAPGEVFF